MTEGIHRFLGRHLFQRLGAVSRPIEKPTRPWTETTAATGMTVTAMEKMDSPLPVATAVAATYSAVAPSTAHSAFEVQAVVHLARSPERLAEPSSSGGQSDQPGRPGSAR